jgi:phosphatidylglycerophosphate synthase
MNEGGAPGVEPVGANPARLWGMTAGQRLARMAAAEKLGPVGPGGRLLANLDFVFAPAWLRWVAERPGHGVTRDDVLVLAHCGSAASAAAARAAMLGHWVPAPEAGLTLVAQERFGEVHDVKLRKREQPFMEWLTDASAPRIERISYFASYKGVTDLLTKYLWPEWALWLTRLAASAGIRPNSVTLVGALLCVAAGILFYRGWYWTGLASGLAFMVLDTVDGKLARCTITSSRIGDALDHGVDLIHPPFWWWAWGMGLEAWGRPLDPDLFLWAMIAIVAGYIVQRVIEGIFIARFGLEIHVWEPWDSRFRLITARRNPNMVILFVGLLLGYPDLGLVAVAGWTVISCLFHLVRLAQAWLRHQRTGPLESWLQ